MVRVEERRAKVKKLYNDGETMEKMAQELGVTINTITRDIKALRENGEIENKKKLKKTEERRVKVKELYNNGENVEKMAQELGVSINTITRDINFLKENGEIENKKELKKIQERRVKVKELYNNGKTTKKIAQILGVSDNTISKDIAYLRKNGKIEKRNTKKQNSVKSKIYTSAKQIEKMRKLCDDFYGQPTSLKRFQEYILYCKFRDTEELLKNDELDLIRNVVTITNKYSDFVFYINLCVKLGKFQEAMKFINTQLNNEGLTKEQINKIKQAKSKIQQTNKKYIATKILKSGRGVEQAVKGSGLAEAEVIEINRKLIGKNNFTNNDNEEVIK